MSDEWTIPTVAVAVDLVVLTIRSASLHVILVERGVAPYVGRLALPGGFLESEAEGLEKAAARELAEETGLDCDALYLEQLRTYGSPARDPRQRVISVAYLAIVPELPEPTPGGDARAAHWMPVQEALRQDLAFDHRHILADGIERARAKLEYTTLATSFCQPQFTVSDLRAVYEIVWGEPLDARNFHRKVTGVTDFLVPTGERTVGQGGRPAALFRRGTAEHLHPAMLRGSAT